VKKEAAAEPPPPAVHPQEDAGRIAAGDIVELNVFPPRLELRGAGRGARLIVTGVDRSSGVRDLTTEAAYSVRDAGIAAVDARGIVTPLADGTTEVMVEAAGLRAAVPVTVADAAVELPINFANDIVPIFSKFGCNAGGCHGKSGGQNGFQLSLFGFTPSVDYNALTREARGRRVFAAAPEHSLLLLKATGRLPHGGGERFPADSPEHALIARWMRAAMPLGRPDDPDVASISVYPRHRALARLARQELAVTAHFTDGRSEDVTRLAQYSVGEPDYLEVSPGGQVRALDLPGQGTVLVRYKGRIASFRATIPSGADVSKAPRPAERNFIDRHVFARLDLLGIAPSALATDAEFLRRACVAICGTTPTAAEAREFLADADPGKRARLVDRLLERPEYASYFALLWADVLRNRRGDQERAAAHTFRFHRWVQESLAANKPFDVFAREILCAEGSVSDNPAVAWYRTLDRPTEIVDDAAQVFLGTRMQCARCHHHPFEKWGQEDYWSFANFFSRLSRRGDSDDRNFTVSLQRGSSRLTDNEPTSASYRKTYEEVKPPGGPRLEETAGGDPRQALADWMRAPENPLFARALVNRYWKHFFARGIVEPEDDLRETNPPSNPELLDALAADFVASGYDLKHLVRTIANSATYQLSSEPNEHNALDRQNFARFQPQRLPAEALLDAIDRAVGARTRFQGTRRDARAIELPDEGGRNYFLEVFGKPDRASACACERSEEVTLPQVLHLLNSREVLGKLAANESRPAELARDPRPDVEKARELFLWVFARPPSAADEARALEHLAGAVDAEKSEGSRRRAWEDLLWALINTKEFLFVR
jgi:hypothetical protein